MRKQKKIIKTLWNIIYSDYYSGIYKVNLMGKLSRLLYLNNKIVGNLKTKIKSNLINWHILLTTNVLNASWWIVSKSAQ